MAKIQMITIFALLFTSLITGCIKENGKKAYSLRLEFSSGDVCEDERIIVEEKNELILSKSSGERINLYKVNKQKLTGISGFLGDVSNSTIINGQSGTISGSLEMEGEYEQQFRKYEVENGTFKFRFHGLMYGMPDSTYTGKWTLKRK